MNKILIEVHIPAINKIHDIKIPRDMYMWQVVELISQSMVYLYPEMYSANNNGIVCKYNTGDLYDLNTLVVDSNLQNGSQVIFV